MQIKDLKKDVEQKNELLRVNSEKQDLKYEKMKGELEEKDEEITKLIENAFNEKTETSGVEQDLRKELADLETSHTQYEAFALFSSAMEFKVRSHVKTGKSFEDKKVGAAFCYQFYVDPKFDQQRDDAIDKVTAILEHGMR